MGVGCNRKHDQTNIFCVRNNFNIKTKTNVRARIIYESDHMGQSILEWTKYNLLKAVLHKFYLVHS